jgi:hypothetical protein
LADSAVSRICALRKGGFSYKEVSHFVDCSVGAAYQYAKNVELSEQGKRRFLSLKKERDGDFARRFASPKQVKVVSQGLSRSKARILGHSLFDGFADKYYIMYANASSRLAAQFTRDLIKNYSGARPVTRVYPLKEAQLYHVYFGSMIASADIRAMILHADERSRQHLCGDALRGDEFILGEIVRAFWEDEGSVSEDGNIIGEIKNRELRDQLLVLHRNLGIEVSPYYDSTYDMWGIYVRRRLENFEIFDRRVGFRNSIVTKGRTPGVEKRFVFRQIFRKRGSLPVGRSGGFNVAVKSASP